VGLGSELRRATFRQSSSVQPPTHTTLTCTHLFPHPLPTPQDDEASPEYNIKSRIDWFVSISRTWAEQMRGNDILYMMGSDFEYAVAHSTFRNLDMLVHYANLDGRINVMYSSPAEYVAAKRGYTNVSWPLKTDDFFPYADCAHCYWTGGSKLNQGMFARADTQPACTG
jgi:hypothetical protein